MNTIADLVIDAVAWERYLTSQGVATGIPLVLRRLLSSVDIREATEAWSDIEEVIFSQGTIYTAAEPTVTVMLAALTEDQPPWRSGRIIDLLFFILTGASSTDPLLQDRCRDRAREGLWLLARWARTHTGWSRDNALEVVEVLDPGYADLIRAAVSGN